MGMYNEVFKRCKSCGRTCELQIPQIELGFGGYNLDRPESYEHLSSDQKKELFESLENEEFYCECGHSTKATSRRVRCPDCAADLKINDDYSVEFIKHNT